MHCCYHSSSNHLNWPYCYIHHKTSTIFLNFYLERAWRSFYGCTWQFCLMFFHLVSILLELMFPCWLFVVIPTLITEVRIDVTTYTEVKRSTARGWSDWFAGVLFRRQTSTCSAGLLSCDVQDPTRLEAPWHGVEAPFPQCYDPAKYICSSNFLCPIGAPKIEGQYACGPYSNQTAQTSSSNAIPTTVSTQVPGCGAGLLLSQVQDPTRLEAPWHGVSAPFPQCYDPTAYICSENFLCPINAPKIHGQYACGPYIQASASSGVRISAIAYRTLS
jgi:hypothetical protein